MICCIGEAGIVSGLMPSNMRAAQSVMAMVTGEDERARDEMDSDGL